MIQEQSQTLLGKTISEIDQIISDLGLPRFVGGQLVRWIYINRACSFDEMTNISKTARENLSKKYSIGRSAPVDSQKSVDGTIKYLYKTVKGDYIETVYIPDNGRATLCVSSQVGCKMHCAFCMTGRQGFMGNLTAADILNQIYSLPEYETLTNVVFMGQGEPFDNIAEVIRATDIMTADYAMAWSPKRITVSSVGVKGGLLRFLDESKCSLAISLHNPFHEERLAMMPSEKAFPISEVLKIIGNHPSFRKRQTYERHFENSRQRRISFEYIVFKGVNDSRRHADELIRLLRDIDCRVNLIRFHAIPYAPFDGVDDNQMLSFRNYLTSHGLFTTLRASRGQDIFAACGLLSTAKKQQETIEIKNKL